MTDGTLEKALKVCSFGVMTLIPAIVICFIYGMWVSL